MADEPSDFKSILADMGMPTSFAGRSFGQEFQTAAAPSYAPQQGPSPQPDAGADTLHQSMSRLGQFGANLGVQSQMNENPTAGVESMTVDKDGMMKAKFHKDVFESLMRDHAQLNEIRGSFHQEAERLRARQEQLDTPAGAIGSAFSRLAGNLAQQKDMPGWVRGLGQTAAQLNPTREELSQERLGILGKEAGITEQDARLSETALRNEDMRDRQNAALEQKKTEARSKSQDAFVKMHENAARINQVSPDHDTFIAAAVKSGRFTPEEAESRYEDLAKTAGSSAQRWEAKKQKEEDIKVSGAKQILEAKTKDVKDRDQLLHGYRQAEIAQRLQGAEDRLGKAQEFNAALKDYSASLGEDKALTSVDKKVKERLVDLKGIERYAASTRDLLDLPEMKGYEGPLTPQRLLPRFAQSPNLVKYNEWVNQELPRINSMVKGGVRMISSPQGREFVKSKLGFTEHMTAEQIRGILDNTDTIIKNERESIMDGTPSAPWKRYPELLGNAYPYADVLASSRSTGRPAPPKPTAGKGVTKDKPKSDPLGILGGP